jgi:anti-sigma-K factor RskA
MGHLSSEHLVDLAEGTANERAARHAAECAQCRRQADDLRAMLVSLDEAGDVPEPSPMFWDHLSARVRDAIRAEPAPRAAFWRRWAGWQPVLAAAAMILLVAVVALRLPRSTRSIEPPIAAPAEQAVELTPVVLDEPLSLLADLASDVDWDTAGDMGTAVSATDQAFSDLDAAERSELHRLLREALTGSGV